MSIWAEIKKAINNTVGTPFFKPLNESVFKTTSTLAPLNNIEREGIVGFKEGVLNTTALDDRYWRVIWHNNEFHVIREYTYLIDYMPSGMKHYKTTDFVNFTEVDSPANPSVTGTFFSYKGKLYAIGNRLTSGDSKLKYCYSFNDSTQKWVSVTTSLPIEVGPFATAHIYKDKVYIYSSYTRAILVFDGTKFTTISTELTSSSSTDRPAQFAETAEGLYIVDSVDQHIYRLDESDNSFYNTGLTFEHNISNRTLFIRIDNKLLFIDNDGNGYRITDDGSFSIMSTSVPNEGVGNYSVSQVGLCQLPTVVGDYLYYFRYSNSAESYRGFYKRNLNNYRDISEYYLPENTLIVFDDDTDEIIPIEGCRKMSSNKLMTTKIGYPKIRTKGFVAKNIILK